MSKINTHRNEPFIAVANIDNLIEAQLLTSILREQKISHQRLSHNDTAYDGLYQMQKGWEEIKAPRSRQAEIKKIIDQIRNQDK